jgi:5-methylcytosine-specific restriction endonuclease McrA
MSTSQGTTAQPRSLDGDPRIIEWLAARQHGGDRYVNALIPYVEAHAEEVDRLYDDQPDTRAVVRVRVMRQLSEPPVDIPLAAVGIGFRANQDELAEVMAAPRSQIDPPNLVEILRRMPYRLYLETPHWKRTREAALKRAGHQCALCPSTTDLQVHHRTYDRRGCERPEDLIVLCDPCHARHHDKLAEA